jgi:glycosyltransferase involved in cell wall biosynthesis
VKSLTAGAVVLPSFNSGLQLLRTVCAALQQYQPVWVVADGSTDGSVEQLEKELAGQPGWEVFRHEQNQGKGACVLTALDEAAKRGLRWILVMDADGQHPAAKIPQFFDLAWKNPEAMILGVPIFGPEAPRERIYGRKVGNTLTSLNSLWAGIGDSLFGFRIYPVEPTRKILHGIRTARRFDFDTEIAIRLAWAGIRPLNVPVPVFYPPRSQGGVTHFNYLRDNLLLARTHLRLFGSLLIRWPVLLFQRWAARAKSHTRA